MEPNGSKTAVMDPAVMRRSVVDQSTDMSTSRPPSPPPPATLDPAYGNVTSANPSGRRGFRGLAARRRSRTKVWLYLLGRWLVTVIFMVVAYAVLIGYEEYEVLSKQQKRQFSALIIGSLIALVLITSSQLTHVVGDLRWWILSCRPRSRAKVEAILRAQSMSSVVVLACKSRRLTIHLAVVTWLAIFLGSQISYALVGLCYSIERSEGKALLRPGNVSVPNLANVDTQNYIKNPNSTVAAQEYTANSYGIVSLAFNVAGLDKIPEPRKLYYFDDPTLFCEGSTCVYVFHETDTESYENPKAIPITVSTNRSVNATTRCSSHSVVQGGHGMAEEITVKVGEQYVNYTLPRQAGTDQSTFMTDLENECGRDCSHLYVFEASDTEPWFYDCTTTLSPVKNARLPEHRLGSSLSRMATSAIALQGFSPTTLPIGTVQSMVYPSASVYATPANGSHEKVEYLLSRFAIGVVGTAAQENTLVTLLGQAPKIGQKLKVDGWRNIHIIFGLTAALQLALAIGCMVVSERVVVPRESAVDEAHIMRPMMADGHSKGEELPREMRSTWIFRDDHLGGGLHDLYMEEVGPSKRQLGNTPVSLSSSQKGHSYKRVKQ